MAIFSASVAISGAFGGLIAVRRKLYFITCSITLSFADRSILYAWPGQSKWLAMAVYS